MEGEGDGGKKIREVEVMPRGKKEQVGRMEAANSIPVQGN